MPGNVWIFFCFFKKSSLLRYNLHTVKDILFFFFNLFLAALGICCCVRAFFSCGERGLLFVAVHRLLIVVAFLCWGAWALGTWASVVAARGLSSCGSWAVEHRLSHCGAWAQLLRGMWDLPGPGLEPVSPALAGGFLTTVPPGKSQKTSILRVCFLWGLTNLCSHINHHHNQDLKHFLYPKSSLRTLCSQSPSSTWTPGNL